MTADQAKSEATRVRLVTCFPWQRVLPICYESGHYGVLVQWPSGLCSILIEPEAVEACLLAIG